MATNVHNCKEYSGLKPIMFNMYRIHTIYDVVTWMTISLQFHSHLCIHVINNIQKCLQLGHSIEAVCITMPLTSIACSKQFLPVHTDVFGDYCL